ncbi:uncharacterized protein, partial [Halyomorpha halys]|uniref:uncharacterized protein n=1 Tax=Halyomorpha halys TaxID=286706 RepID=UPI0034D2A356
FGFNLHTHIYILFLFPIRTNDNKINVFYYRHVRCSPRKKSSLILSQGSIAEGRPSFPRQCSKKSSLNSAGKSVQETKNDVKPLPRTSDKNSVKSSKRSTPGRKSLEDPKKSLRPKKPLNFAESPVTKMNQKRKRKLEKAVK